MSDGKSKHPRREFFKAAGGSGLAIAAVIAGSAEAQNPAPSAAGQPPPRTASRMLRQLWFGYLNGVDRAEGERWYYRFHAPEFVRWYGPWLRRYETYAALDPPPEAAARYGAKPGKYTEMWWPSLEELEEANPYLSNRPYTPGTWERGSAVILSAVTMIPARPTEEFIAAEPNHEQPIVRWLRVWRYPEGVSREEGDQWYLEVHAPEAKAMSGLLRFVSYRTVEYPRSRAGAYATWHRVDELWFSDLTSWRKAVIESPPKYTPPRWSKDPPYVNMVSDFVRVKADVDFLKDSPRIP